MARRPVTPLRAELKTYYIFDAGVKDVLGGVKVKQIGDQRTVQLTAQQAQYWIQVGAIGEQPLAAASPELRTHLNQVSGGRIPLEEGGKSTRPKLSAIEPAATSPGELVAGSHPVTGKRLGGRSGGKGKVVFSQHEGLLKDEI